LKKILCTPKGEKVRQSLGYHRNFIIAVLPSQFYHRSFIIVVLLPQSILSPQIHKHLRNGLIKNTLKIPSLKMLSATVHGIHQLVLLQ